MAAVVALVFAAASVVHPVAGWLPGLAHKSDVPPVVGAGLLLIPVLAVGWVVRQLWFELSLRRAVRQSDR